MKFTFKSSDVTADCLRRSFSLKSHRKLAEEDAISDSVISLLNKAGRMHPLERFYLIKCKNLVIDRTRY